MITLIRHFAADDSAIDARHRCHIDYAFHTPLIIDIFR
jgi:hypothetical protein